MKDFAMLARERKTTYEFSNKEVSDELINKILETARWSPSSLNSQPWKFVIIKKKSSIKELVDSSYYGDFHTMPPVIIIPVIDGNYITTGQRGVKDGKVGLTDAYLSIAMPIMNMCLQAKDLGIDSCILTPNEATAKRIINASKKDHAVIMVGLGYELKNVYQKTRERKKLSELVYHEIIKSDD
ncbi:MAG TPA: nitroreductase family protein [Candidatus Nanoarchaeia archaeon]|nr:nitroreductase family protein [Candidatus Nanoarchaeia archaeon]